MMPQYSTSIWRQCRGHSNGATRSTSVSLQYSVWKPHKFVTVRPHQAGIMQSFWRMVTVQLQLLDSIWCNQGSQCELLVVRQPLCTFPSAWRIRDLREGTSLGTPHSRWTPKAALLGTSCCCCVRKGPICTWTTLVPWVEDQSERFEGNLGGGHKVSTSFRLLEE